jgi:hypothetical protein
MLIGKEVLLSQIGMDRRENSLILRGAVVVST